MESWVGIPLINRDTYPVQLTAAGAQFLPVAREMIATLSETRQTIRDADRGDSRFIRISALHTISVNYLATRIENMQRKIPDLRTRVISDSLSTCCDLLAEGAVDMMLCYFHHRVSSLIDEAVFERKDLLTERLIPVAAAGPVRELGWDISKADAAPIPYLAYERSSFLGMVVEDTVGKRALNAEMIYVDSLVETIKRRMLQGSGFAWIPASAIQSELASGVVVPVGDASWTADLTIAALSNPETIDPAAQALWEFL